jgi:RDD family
VKAEMLVQPAASYSAVSIAREYVPCKMSKRLMAFAFDAAALGVCIFAGATLSWLVAGAAISFDLTQPGPDNGLLADTRNVRLTTYVSVVISLCYFIGSWLMLSASPGQRVFGIRLRSVGTGKAVGVGQAFGRWILLGAPLWIVSTAMSNELGAALTIATMAWSAFLLVSTLRSDTGRGAHDRWTGSTVTSVARASDKSRVRPIKPDVR